MLAVFSVLWATLKKELHEVLRDKRTLLLTILVPLGFYPAMSLMTKDMEQKQMAKVNGRVTSVGVSGWGDDSELNRIKMALFNIEWKPVSLENRQKLLESGEIDVFLDTELTEVDGVVNRKVDIHYFSTVNGMIAHQKVKMFLEAVKREEVAKRMEGREYLLKPIEVVAEKDHATARAVSGSKFGGMGAYFIVFLAFTGCMAVAVDTAAGEKERGTLEAMLVTPAPFIGIALGKLGFIMMMGVLSVLSTMGGIVIMVLGFGGGGSGFNLAEVGAVPLLGIAGLLLSLVLLFAAVLFAFSILARSMKEASVRSSMIMIVIAMLLVYCVIPGVELTQTIMWIPVLNGAMSIKELWSGGMAVGDYFQVLTILLTLSALVLVWVSWRVNTDREGVLLKQ